MVLRVQVDMVCMVVELPVHMGYLVVFLDYQEDQEHQVYQDDRVYQGYQQNREVQEDNIQNILHRRHRRHHSYLLQRQSRH